MTPTTTNDRALAEALQRGDTAAVRATWSRFGRPVTTLAFGVLGDGGLAGEAVLATFVRMAATPHSFDGGVDPAPLVFAMARSEVTDKWQSALEARRETDASDVSSGLGSIPIDAARAAWEIRTAIDQLDDEQQELLKLVHFAGMSPSEIVAHLSTTPDELQQLSKESHRRLASLLAHLDPNEQTNLDRITELLRNEAMWADAGDAMATAIASAIKANGRLTTGSDNSPSNVFTQSTTNEGPTGASMPNDEPKVIVTEAPTQPIAARADSAVAFDRESRDLSLRGGLPTPLPSVDRLALQSDRSSENDPLSSDADPTWGGQSVAEGAVPPVEPVAPALGGSAARSLSDSRRPAVVSPSEPDVPIFESDTTLPDGAGSSAGTADPRRRSNGTSLLAIAAILVGLVMGLGTLIAMQRGGSDLLNSELTLVGTELAPPGASASVLLVDAPSGVEVTMLLENLGAAPADTYFEGWVHTIGDAQVSIGSFHLRRGETRVTGVAGVPLADLAGVSVTLEPVGGPPGPSGAVLSGTIGAG